MCTQSYSSTGSGAGADNTTFAREGDEEIEVVFEQPGSLGAPLQPTMRAELIGHFKPCMTDIYLHIVARMAD